MISFLIPVVVVVVVENNELLLDKDAFFLNASNRQRLFTLRYDKIKSKIKSWNVSQLKMKFLFSTCFYLVEIKIR
jgi:hypothetical protein